MSTEKPSYESVCSEVLHPCEADANVISRAIHNTNASCVVTLRHCLCDLVILLGTTYGDQTYNTNMRHNGSGKDR